MINLYDSKEIDFTRNGLVVLNECKSCFITEELNGNYFLELEYPALDSVKIESMITTPVVVGEHLAGEKEIKIKKPKSSYIDGWRIIKADGQLFRIPIYNNIQSDGLTVTATAPHIFYDLLNDYNEDTRATDKTAQEALQIAIAVNPKFSVGTCDDLGESTAYFVTENPVKGIYDKILPRWKGELLRDNFVVSVKERLGSATGILISYGKNITGFTQTPDWANVATRIKPVGKEGARIDLVNGGSSWLESPRINDYPFVISKEIKFESITDATELKNAALALWGTIDIPTCNYNVNFVDLSKVKEYEVIKALLVLKLGDTVTIKHKIFNVDISARVIKIKKNVLTGKIEELELGQFKENLFNKFSSIDKQIKYTQESVVEVKDDLEETKTTVFQNDEQISLQAVAINALDERVDSAELKITAEAIISTVTSSTEYTDDIGGLDSRLNSAELKITADAITSTVRSSEEYINDLGEKITEEEASTIAQTASNILIGFNGISNVIDMSPDGLQVNHTDGSYTKLKAEGIKKHIGSTDRDYHYLTATGSAVSNGNASEYSIQLPDEFKNKLFTISVSVKSTVYNGYYLTDFVADWKLYVEAYDYPNARFAVIAYWIASNHSTYDDKPLEFTWVATA